MEFALLVALGLAECEDAPKEGGEAGTRRRTSASPIQKALAELATTDRRGAGHWGFSPPLGPHRAALTRPALL